MKRFLSIILAAAMAITLLASCEEDSNSGKASYSYGFTSMAIGSIELAQKITYAYETEFHKIGGAVLDKSAILLDGDYSKMDTDVMNACKAAESALSGISIPDGQYVTFGIDVLYMNSGKMTEGFYSKTYGNR